MDILLCGANDLSQISEAFLKVVNEFGAQARYFGNATIFGSNNREWKESSKKTVKECDIIVYAIIEQYGKITWETEFETARQEGKQFLVFCLSGTWEFFLKARNGNKKIYSDHLKDNHIYKVLDDLLEIEADVVPFTYGSFESQLKFQLLKLFKEGMQSLESDKKKSLLNKLIIDKNFDEIKNKIKFEKEKEHFIKILMDVFGNKEIRKRILEFFADNKGLSDEEIILLMNDAEQGVSRKTIELLPMLTSKSSDIDLLFESTIEIANTSDDVGTDRRIIKSLLTIDAEKGIKHLKNLFPVTDIGTPKRILSFLDDNDVKIGKETIDTLQELVTACESFRKGTDTIKNLGKSVRKKYGLNDNQGTDKNDKDD